jgi:hypothetical protein
VKMNVDAVRLRLLSSKAFYLISKFSHFLVTSLNKLKVLYKGYTLVSNLGQINPVHNRAPFSLKLYFFVSVPSTCRFSKFPLSFRFPAEIPTMRLLSSSPHKLNTRLAIVLCCHCSTK